MTVDYFATLGVFADKIREINPVVIIEPKIPIIHA